MNSNASPDRTRRHPAAFFTRLGRNYVYLLAGLPIAIFSFSLLLSLTVVSFATLVVWLGFLLLPLTLLIASAFAALSRKRVVAWGATLEPVSYRSRSLDRKSTRLNSSHVSISYAVFCLKKKILN